MEVRKSATQVQNIYLEHLPDLVFPFLRNRKCWMEKGKKF